LITLAVQALAGVLLPSAAVFLLLLCNDRDVLGPWVNRPWLNAIACLIIGVLLVMSLVLVATTVFPHVNVGALSLALGCALLGALAVGIAMVMLRRRVLPAGQQAAVPRDHRESWRMPPLALLGRPSWSRGRLVGMWALRGYLVVAVVLLVVKAVQLGS
jgi:hypothetical protein